MEPGVLTDERAATAGRWSPSGFRFGPPRRFFHFNSVLLNQPQLVRSARHEFVIRVVTAIVLVAAAALIWYAGEVLLLTFAGLLLAVLLDSFAGWLSRFAKLGRGWAFAVVVISLFVLAGLTAWEVVPRVADQISGLVHSFPQNLSRIQSYLNGRDWGRTLLQHLPDMLGSANLTGEISALAKKASEGVIGLVVVAVVGLYAGANPSLYERGVLKLFPDQYRDRAREVLGGVIHTLRWWMLGQLVPMIAVGIATIVAFEILDVQPAFTLGLFTGFMVFIPYIGSLIAFGVVLLLVLVQGFTKVLSVTILFIAIHVAEGYLLTPNVQKRAVYLPPALTIVTQVLMGLLLGFLGFALATPLTAAALVLIRMLYLHEAAESRSR